MRTDGPVSALDSGSRSEGGSGASARFAATASPSCSARASSPRAVRRLTAPPVATAMPPSTGCSARNMRAMGTPSPGTHALKRSMFALASGAIAYGTPASRSSTPSAPARCRIALAVAPTRSSVARSSTVDSDSSRVFDPSSPSRSSLSLRSLNAASDPAQGASIHSRTDVEV